MTILFGTYALPERGVVFSEDRGDIGGRDRRTVRITGVLEDFASLDALESTLDGLIHAASLAGDATLLSLRPGRELVVRRTAFHREHHAAGPVAAFKLEFEALDPVERAIDATLESWAVTAASPSRVVAAEGNHPAPLVISLASDAAVHGLSASDGVRTIHFGSTVFAGQTLVFDGEAGKGYLDGEDVTPLLSGDFPCATPPESTLTFGVSLFSELAGAASVSFHARWW